MSQPQLLESGKTGASSDWTDGGFRSSVCALVRQHIPIGLVNLRSIPDIELPQEILKPDPERHASSIGTARSMGQP